jgi:hypothetical protein
METKQTIPAGTKWGTLTYLYDVENHKPTKRPIRVRCDCGVIKSVDLAALRSGSTGSCGTLACRNKRRALLMEQVKVMEQKLITRNDGKDRELAALASYWREIERTGNVHNVAKGMEMTTNFLKK